MLLLGLSVCLMPQACAATENVDEAGPCTEGLDALFLGNSYTYANDLPRLVRSLSEAGGCSLATDQHTPGGVDLHVHVLSSTTRDFINSREWDVVVLQNQSQKPAHRPDDVKARSLPDAVALASAVRSVNPEARIVYYVTWGRRDGDAVNCSYYSKVCTFAGHTDALVEGYSMYAEATEGELALVGPAWKAVMLDPEAPSGAQDLWAEDGSHPSLVGSYLAACVFYRQFYGRSPVGLEFTAGLPRRLARYLQETAEKVAGDMGDGRWRIRDPDCYLPRLKQSAGHRW